ncbi:hypothetical protein AO946_08965 [Pseudomonas aeruginosa]|nr:hypothetical protein AO946_08965 [Pseudomonas aeruginosa]PBN23827.1 hypothetical protein B8B65_28835 [Pseudomonas aeruginosa]
MGMPTVQIQHSYLQKSACNVNTHLSFEDLQIACAYLQVLRDQLPCFSTVSDVLTPEQAVKLLTKLYGGAPPSKGRARTIDLYDNWDEYALLLLPGHQVKSAERMARRERYQEALLRLARPGARLSIIQVMLEEAILRAREDRGAALQKLHLIQDGSEVPKDWQLAVLCGTPYTGALARHGQPDMIEVHA